jgi:hypothetical protein
MLRLKGFLGEAEHSSGKSDGYSNGRNGTERLLERARFRYYYTLVII